MEGNVIGTLQEFCQAKKGHPMPQYEDEKKAGPPHAMTFTVSCQVGAIKELGEGGARQKARKDAAQKVLDRLINGEPVELASNQKLEEPELTVEQRELFEDMFSITNIRVEDLSKSACEKVVDFYKKLKTGNGENLQKIQNPLGREENYWKILEDFAAEQNVECNFEPNDHQTELKEYQCTIRILSLPTVVTFGAGETMEEAKQVAARSSLHYIQLMIKNLRKQ